MSSFLHIICSIAILLGGGVTPGQAGDVGCATGTGEHCCNASESHSPPPASACCRTECSAQIVYSSQTLSGGCCAIDDSVNGFNAEQSDSCPCSSSGCCCPSGSLLTFVHVEFRSYDAVQVSSISLGDDLLSGRQDQPGSPPPKFQNSLA